eukprot:9213517-Pyramimonas_sp.AAC.1
MERETLAFLRNSGGHMQTLRDALVERQLVLVVEVMPSLALHGDGALAHRLLRVPPHWGDDDVRVGPQVAGFRPDA